jgi:hypothetical protein
MLRLLHGTTKDKAHSSRIAMSLIVLSFEVRHVLLSFASCGQVPECFAFKLSL